MYLILRCSKNPWPNRKLGRKIAFSASQGYQNQLFGKERDPMRVMPTFKISEKSTNENEGGMGRTNGRRQATKKGGDKTQI